MKIQPHHQHLLSQITSPPTVQIPNSHFPHSFNLLINQTRNQHPFNHPNPHLGSPSPYDWMSSGRWCCGCTRLRVTGLHRRG
ncbi:hypothetical protein HanPSC8_Chr16g0705351 [Helianthus annuus]|nr:hypothetical protein HanPSC8_Chr16g0705351 [Helianthus annuus]